MDIFREDSLDSMFACVIKLHFDNARSQFGKLGLFRGQPPVLFALWKQNGQTQTELSEKLLIKPATMTVILQRMEKAGFVERGPDAEDLRISRVYLTEKGVKIQAEVEVALKNLEEKCFRGFTMEEKVLLRRFFLQMQHNLQRVNDESLEKKAQECKFD